MTSSPEKTPPVRTPGAIGATALSPAREAALSVLQRLANPRSPGADRLIEDEARLRKLTPRDLALTREIAFGVLRHRLWIEQIIARYVTRSFADSAPSAHDALVCGVFQLVYLDRVPDHAAVNETVELVARQPRGAKLRGLANAVMRRVAKVPPEDLLPKDSTDWRLRFSIPDSCATLLEESLPAEELDAFFEAVNVPAPLCIRPAGMWSGSIEEFTRQLAAEVSTVVHEAVSPRPGHLIPTSMHVAERGIAPGNLPLFRKGEATIEDEGAQVALLLALGADKPRRVLDLCGSPGGKTAQLCDLLPRGTEIISCDVSDAKLQRTRDTLTRLGHDGRVTLRLSSDMLHNSPAATFDFVLVDAPCSGLGTLRRHPEIRYRRTAEDIGRLAAAQQQLLAEASRLVAPGGILAYSVCTVTRAEGEQQAARFLTKNPAFAADDQLGDLPFDPAKLSVTHGIWRTWPHKHGCDGFTIARFRRTE